MVSALLQDGESFITDVFATQPDDFLSTDEVRALTPQIVIERLHALKPFIASRAHETEKRGRPSDEVWRAILRTGYMYLSIPRQFGGLQASMMEIMDATLPIAQADGSVGWLASFVVMTPRPAAGYPIELQRELFAGGKAPAFVNVILPMGTAKRVPGGYKVTGRWAWATTVQVADWVSMICRIEGEDDEPVRTFLTPASTVKIVNTWDVAGMAATGTHHVVAEDLFVPETHVSHSNNGSEAWSRQVRKHHADYDLFLGPPGAALSLNVTVPVLGAAQGGIEAARAHLLRYSKRSGISQEKEKMAAQIRLAHASSLITAAEQLMRHAIRECFGMIRTANAEDEELFHQIRAWLAETCELCRQAMNVLVQSAGTTIYSYDSPLGRAYRDVLVGSSHMVCDYDTCMQAYGQKMLGIAPPKRGGYAERDKVRDEIKATTRAHAYAKT